MPAENPKRSIAARLVTLKQLLGAPPILSTESADAYEALLGQLIECLDPEDVLGLILANQIMNSTWEISRLTRQKSLAVERQYNRHLQIQADRKKVQAEQAAQQKQLARERAQNSGKPINEVDQMFKLDDVIEDRFQEIKTLLDRPATEFDHARALEEIFKYYEALTKSIASEMVCRDIALRQLEQHRDNLAQRLRRGSDQIIDVEAKKADDSIATLTLVSDASTIAPQMTEMGAEVPTTGVEAPPIAASEPPQVSDQSITESASPPAQSEEATAKPAGEDAQ
jgi:hypothetical protein